MIYWFTAATTQSATEIVARLVATQTGLPASGIQVAPPYQETGEALRNRAAHELAADLSVNPPISSARTLIICYPNWFNALPVAVMAFLKQAVNGDCDVYPVCVHSGSGLGTTVDQIRDQFKNAHVHPGLPIRATRVSRAGTAIQVWATENGLNI